MRGHSAPKEGTVLPRRAQCSQGGHRYILLNTRVSAPKCLVAHPDPEFPHGHNAHPSKHKVSIAPYDATKPSYSALWCYTSISRLSREFLPFSSKALPLGFCVLQVAPLSKGPTASWRAGMSTPQHMQILLWPCRKV